MTASSETDINPERSVHVFPTYDALSRAAAQHVAAHVETVLASQNRYALALAGGSTPRRLYELLGEDFPALPWSQIDLFWGDERFVPSDDTQSNERLVRNALIDPVGIPAGNVYPVPTHLSSPQAAADAYETTLRNVLSPRSEQENTFDLVLLGLGGDGHTASIFPEDLVDAPSLGDANGALPDGSDTGEWVRAVEAPPRHDVSDRITCTLQAINASREALFLVSGTSKQDAVQRVLDERDPLLPATHVAPREALTWFLDAEARG